MFGADDSGERCWEMGGSQWADLDSKVLQGQELGMCAL